MYLLVWIRIKVAFKRLPSTPQYSYAMALAVAYAWGNDVKNLFVTHMILDVWLAIYEIDLDDGYSGSRIGYIWIHSTRRAMLVEWRQNGYGVGILVNGVPWDIAGGFSVGGLSIKIKTVNMKAEGMYLINDIGLWWTWCFIGMPCSSQWKGLIYTHTIVLFHLLSFYYGGGWSSEVTWLNG